LKKSQFNFLRGSSNGLCLSGVLKDDLGIGGGGRKDVEQPADTPRTAERSMILIVQ
jgi:hypothetical protein